MRKILSRTVFCGLTETNQEFSSCSNNDNQIVLAQAYLCLPAEDIPIKGVAMHLQGDSLQEIINHAKQINADKQGYISLVAVNGGDMPTMYFDAVCKGDTYEIAYNLIKMLKQKPIKYLDGCFVFSQNMQAQTCHISGVFNFQDMPKNCDVIAALRPLWLEWQKKTTERMAKLSGFVRINFAQTGLNLI